MSQIPFSNPAGNNQMTPQAPTTGGIPAPGGPVGTGNNPYSPVTGHPIPVTGAPVQQPGITPGVHPHPMAADNTVLGGPTIAGGASTQPGMPRAVDTPGGQGGTSSQNGFITDKSSYSSGQNDLSKQLIDMYGKGVGGSLFTLLQSMSGTDSKILQEYIASLQPEMAKSQANVNAALGAGGIGANSSVAAIADANLQAQEFAAISGESASLTKGQEALTASILTGMSGDAAKEVATSGWSVFADVMNNITGDIGNLMGGNYQNKKPGAGTGSTANIPISSQATGVDYNSGSAGTMNELGANVGAQEAPFAVGDSSIENNPSIIPYY